LPEGILGKMRNKRNAELEKNGFNSKNRAALPVKVKRLVRYFQYANSCLVSVE
jgi:hypothetical protein